MNKRSNPKKDHLYCKVCCIRAHSIYQFCICAWLLQNSVVMAIINNLPPLVAPINAIVETSSTTPTLFIADLVGNFQSSYETSAGLMFV